MQAIVVMIAVWRCHKTNCKLPPDKPIRFFLFKSSNTASFVPAPQSFHLQMSTLYGIDRGMLLPTPLQPTLLIHHALEIHHKIQSKYSIDHEQQARAWIENVVGEPLPSDDFQESLKDGVMLCKWVFCMQCIRVTVSSNACIQVNW